MPNTMHIWNHENAFEKVSKMIDILRRFQYNNDILMVYMHLLLSAQFPIVYCADLEEVIVVYVRTRQ